MRKFINRVSETKKMKRLTHRMFVTHSTKLKKIMKESSSFENKLFYRMRQDYMGILNTLSDIGKRNSL